MSNVKRTKNSQGFQVVDPLEEGIAVQAAEAVNSSKTVDSTQAVETTQTVEAAQSIQAGIEAAVETPETKSEASQSAK